MLIAAMALAVDTSLKAVGRLSLLVPLELKARAKAVLRRST